MSKKILISTFLILICSSFGRAETDNPWDKFLSFSALSGSDLVGKENQTGETSSDFVSTGIGDNLAASPQTFCATNPFATSCQNTCARGPFPGGYLWRYQNPIDGCPDTVYPFRVSAISISVTNCGAKPCTLSLEGGIYRIAGRDTCPDGKICRTPGDLICPTELKTVILSPVLQCTTVFLRLLDTTCCVYSSYFAGVKLEPPSGCIVNPCLDDSRDTCRGSWYWDGRSSDTLNMLCDMGFQQNLCINSYGYVRDQNNCPRLRINRGIRSITILPGPQIDQAEIQVEWFVQLFPPNPFFPPNPNQPPNPNIDASSMLDIQLLAEPRPDPIMLDIPLVFAPPNPIMTQSAASPLDTHMCIGSKPPCGTGLCPYVVAGADPLNCVQAANDTCVCEYTQISSTIVGVGANASETEAIINWNLNFWCNLCPVGCQTPYPCGSCCCFVCGDPEPYPADEAYSGDDMMTVPTCVYKPGDVNVDGMYNLADIIREVNIVFKGAPKQPLMCLMYANGDKMANLTDIIYDVNHVFKGGPKPNPSGVCCK